MFFLDGVIVVISKIVSSQQGSYNSGYGKVSMLACLLTTLGRGSDATQVGTHYHGGWNVF
jgi:hypothetical protein